MADTSPFAKFVPGFDFLQGLVSNAGTAMPGIGQWVTPTLNPQELEKRIEELRTVQFWLEQNARMLGATIQAMEVQRMTLSTLKTMNVQMEDLRDALKIKMPEAPSGGGFFGRPLAPAPDVESMPAEPPSPAIRPMPEAMPDLGAAAPPPGVDPMQWWGALTQQFAQLAAQAMKPGVAAATQTLDDAGAAAAPASASQGTSAKAARGAADPSPSPKAGRPVAKGGVTKVPLRSRTKPKA
ncbi:MAG: PhaM family polyhydroxyalkanoate granule multifunctional regulatory protein [Pseudomonadota bacterium]